jgi:hypothetical protein
MPDQTAGEIVDVCTWSLDEEFGIFFETSNIVLSQKAGRVRRYALAPQALAGAERWMLDQREIWEQRLDRMQDYVEGLATNKEKP